MTCPICAKNMDPKYRPFCSRRCADIDLAHWINGTYSVPSQAEDDAFEVPEAIDDAERKPH